MIRQKEEFMEKLGQLMALVIALAIKLIIATLLVFFMWNAVVPALFGLSVITVWQAMGLFLLCDTLFKGASTPPKTNKNND